MPDEFVSLESCLCGSPACFSISPITESYRVSCETLLCWVGPRKDTAEAAAASWNALMQLAHANKLTDG